MEEGIKIDPLIQILDTLVDCDLTYISYFLIDFCFIIISTIQSLLLP